MSDLIDFNSPEKSKVCSSSVSTGITENNNALTLLEQNITRKSFPDIPTNLRYLKQKSSSLSCLQELNDDDVFKDSVFIEAHHIASKIADGSILDESFEEGNILDCTPHPEWNISETEETNEECDCASVFKAVDKLVPAIGLSTGSCSSDSESKSDISPVNNNSQSLSRNDCLQNLSDILKTDSANASKASSNSSLSRSQDVKEIVKSLTDILSTEHRDSRQTLEGQNLLFYLAGILCSSDASNNQNARHTSLDMENYRSDDALDGLSCEALDLSVKSKHDDVLEPSKHKYSKQRSSSFSFPNSKVPPYKMANNLNSQTEKMKQITLSMSGDSFNNSSRTNSHVSISRLKPINAVSAAPLKKGPIRAVIPLNNMSKNKKNEYPVKQLLHKTPTRTRIQQTCKSKRTTLSVSDINPRPMAQSTPEERKSLSIRNTKLLRPRLINQNGVRSDSLCDLNKSSLLPGVPVKVAQPDDGKKSFTRRSSASDLKSVNPKIQLRRTGSIGKENHLPASPKLTGKCIEGHSLKLNIKAPLTHGTNKNNAINGLQTKLKMNRKL